MSIKTNKELQELIEVLINMHSIKEMNCFLTDLCTPAELAAMAGRWKAAQMVEEKISYREIYEKSGVSTATVTRVSRCVSAGAGGYRLALDRLKSKRKSK